MVYGVLQLINFAHGEIYMVGAFVGLLLVTVVKLPFLTALPGAMLIASLVGVTVEFVAYRPLRRSSRLAVLISAIGMSIFLSNLGLWIFGPATRSFQDRKSTRLNSSHVKISYAVFCLKKK